MASPTAPPTALELARAIRDGDDSSEAAVERALARIAALNPTLNAFVVVHPKRALRAARAKDKQQRKGAPLPPFHGVPIGIKDVNAVRGMGMRLGSRSYRWLKTPTDDAIVRLIRRAGFVILGKLSTSELGLRPLVEPEIHPPTCNPANPEYSAGGSSGGSGAAVGSGMLPIAPGSDGAGSVRIPAAYCGLFGFKPSRGLVVAPHARIDPNGMVVSGPLARTVADAAALLDVLAAQSMTAEDSFSTAQAITPESLKIRMCMQPPMGETDAEFIAPIQALADVLRGLGHTVEETDPPAASLAEFEPIYAHLFSQIPVLAKSKLQPVTRWFRTVGKTFTAADAQRAHAVLSERIAGWMGDADVLLSPTTAIPPPRVGAFAELDPAAMWQAISPIGVFTAGFNVSGQPAATIPVGHTQVGLPIGAQLVGREGADRALFALAFQVEQALGGFDRLRGQVPGPA